MRKKLVIVLSHADAGKGEDLGAPIFQAALAAAMGYEVEVMCTGTAGQLMRKGVPESLFMKPGGGKTIHDFIKDAHEAGVKFLCCSPALDLFEIQKEDLIPECDRIVGSALLIEEIMERDCKVLTY
jgi:predicted peroxiredoxin